VTTAPAAPAAIHPTSTSAAVDPTTMPAGTLIDVHGYAHAAYRVNDPALVLVRPDGYLALMAEPGDAAAVLSYLKSPLRT
jgi:hypothetical protein